MPERHPLSERFHELLVEVGAMHDAKQEDYGTDYDPFANVRESTKFGVPGWAGVAIRMNDKMVRLQKAVQDTLAMGEPNLRNEGVLDTFLDLSVYAIIGHILYEDWLIEQEMLREQEMRDLEVYLNSPEFVAELRNDMAGAGVPEWMEVDDTQDNMVAGGVVLPLHYRIENE